VDLDAGRLQDAHARAGRIREVGQIHDAGGDDHVQSSLVELLGLEWIPGVGWEPGAGTPNDNLTLFSFTGKALPSVGLFQSPLAVCRHFDPWFEGACAI
jgi:hypothetical protein